MYRRLWPCLKDSRSQLAARNARPDRAYCLAGIQRILVEETKTQSRPTGGLLQLCNVVIHERALNKLADIFEKAKTNSDLELLVGGKADKSKGYYIYPTIYKTSNSRHDIMERELFGPVLCVYIYRDSEWNDIHKLMTRHPRTR